MADNLPEPKSRKESYLAKAAGMDVTIPEAPESRTEQYLAAIAEGGGGGGTSDFDELTNRPKYNGTTMTSETDIPAAPTVVQTTGTSQTDVMSQKATTGMVFADPSTKNKVQIASGAAAGGATSIAIGTNAQTSTLNGIAIGTNAAVQAGKWNSVALGSSAIATRAGEVYVGAPSTTQGYNSTEYRVIGGVHDGQLVHDAATVGQALGTDESYTVATGDWTALSASSPYTYQATVTATYTIGNDTTVELINDAPVTFGNYGFAIGSVSGQNVAIYSIGQPSASVTLKVNYKG